MKKLICLFIALLMIAGLCACSAAKSESSVDADPAEKPASLEPTDIKGSGADGEEAEPSAAKDMFASKAEDIAPEGGAKSAERDDGGYAVIDDPVVPSSPDIAADFGGEDGGVPGDEPPADTTPIEAGTLTAGEWKDNDNYDFWRKVLAREEWAGLARLWKMDVTKRFAVTVSDGQNTAKNAAVELLDAEGNVISRAVTDSYGKAYLYYDIDSAGKVPAAVSVGGAQHEITADQLAAGGATVSGAGERYTKLDLMFTTDTTGSMTDELEYLKKEMGSVIERVAGENDGLDIRLSVNFYRDEGDEYVVRSFAFSGDIEEVIRQLDQQFSDGGGDYPEAVHTALDDSVNGHDWRDDAVKLLFLTLDAPGHSDAAGVPESVRASVVAAAAKGIRIIPVAASGVDTETEFMLRAMACATGGTYIFLTDHSGVGESHLEPTIGDYNVKKLNDLLVKVISEYCK
ncbi:MAG: VWA domain-containing protein [Clostridia bacterium]|nr:VWA domain-containing protein [Clostridia bacterium]